VPCSADKSLFRESDKAVFVFLGREKQDNEKSSENVDVDAATVCSLTGAYLSSDVGAEKPSPWNVSGGSTEDTSEYEVQCPVGVIGDSSTPSNQTSTPPGETVSTGDSVVAVKSEPPSSDEPTDSTPRSDGHTCDNCCHDDEDDVIKVGRCHDQHSVQLTAGCPTRLHGCPCIRLPSVVDASVAAQEQSRRRRRRPGLSRLRRTEQRRRSRMTANVTEDFAGDDDDGKGSTAEDGHETSRTAPSDVIRAEPQSALEDQTKRDEKTEPEHNGASTTAMQTTWSTVNARRSPDEETNDEASADITCERDGHVTYQHVTNEIKRPFISTAAASAGSICPTAAESVAAVSTSLHTDDALSRKGASLIRVGRSLDLDVCSPPPAGPRAFCLPVHRTLTLSVGADNVHGGRIVGGEVVWQRCVGKRSGGVLWAETRGVTVAVPVLRCALTSALNAIAVVHPYAGCVPRHVPFFYPRYRLLCHPSSPSCV